MNAEIERMLIDFVVCECERTLKDWKKRISLKCENENWGQIKRYARFPIAILKIFKTFSKGKSRTLFWWSLKLLSRHLQFQLCWVIFTHLVTFEQLQTAMLRVVCEKKTQRESAIFRVHFRCRNKVESDLLLAARNWVRYKRGSISWHRGRRREVFLLHFLSLFSKIIQKFRFDSKLRSEKRRRVLN